MMVGNPAGQAADGNTRNLGDLGNRDARAADEAFHYSAASQTGKHHAYAVLECCRPQ